jgi:hypothetical protein
LERVIGALAAHVTMGEAPQIFVNERCELSESGVVSLSPIGQELSHFLRRVRKHIHAFRSFYHFDEKISRPEASEKYSYSDGHFAPRFLFLSVKGKL